MRTIRLTMAQALLRFLDAQYVELDDTEHKFVHGVMGIFGHGNVTGLGEALEYGDSGLRFIPGNNEQGLVHAATWSLHRTKDAGLAPNYINQTGPILI